VFLAALWVTFSQTHPVTLLERKQQVFSPVKFDPRRNGWKAIWGNYIQQKNGLQFQKSNTFSIL
jgi:hypothetical protein